MTPLIRFAVMLAVLLMAGCNVKFEKPPLPDGPWPRSYDDTQYDLDDSTFPLRATTEHQVLRPGDRVKIALWGDSTVSGEYEIGPDGMITVPLLGDIPVSNTLRLTVREQVAERAKRYFNEPSVEVSVAKYAPRFAYIFGALGQPGAKEIMPDETLLTLIARAGGILQRENERGQSLGIPRVARVVRNRTTLAQIDLRKVYDGSDLRGNIAIFPGDMVYISREDTPTVTVLGAVNNPGILGLGPGMDVSQAIGIAGGLTDDANRDDVRVIRRWWTSEPQIFQFRLYRLEDKGLAPPILLQDQDIVFVDNRSIAKWNYFLRQITPSFVVLRPPV